MESIREYARQISLYLIFDSVVGIILPTSKYKKYISLVSGLILILIMVKPINNILMGGALFNFSSSHSHYQLAKEVYERAYENQIKKISEDAGLKIEDIKIGVGDRNLIQDINLKLEQPNQKNLDSLKNTLCLLYNLKPENVNLN